MSAQAPAFGEIDFYDYFTPALASGNYRVSVTTEVPLTSEKKTYETSRFVEVVSAPLHLAPTDVVGVYPPAGGRGSYERALPHVTLGRRTLPWERSSKLGAATAQSPWLALIVVEDGEYELQSGRTLADPALAAVKEAVKEGVDPSAQFEVVDADAGVLAAVLPTVDDLAWLAHTRRVNVDDRELAAGDSDGWFAVVVANRLPRPGASYRACLVSVEGRDDLIKATAPSGPSTADPTAEAAAMPSSPVNDFEPALADVVAEFAADASTLVARLRTLADLEILTLAELRSAGPDIRSAALDAVYGPVAGSPPGVRPRAKLVCLHSWQFTCEGGMTFRELMTPRAAPTEAGLDVGLIGDGHPGVTRTGHLLLDHVDRAGEHRRAWYRGPLGRVAPSRDTLGPYQASDQARRVSPETGVEDISYSCAFEVGRLIACADGRLAQELARWRRRGYRERSRLDSLKSMLALMDPDRWLALPDDLLELVRAPALPVIGIELLERVRLGAGPLGDPWTVRPLSGVPGLDPARVQEAWGVSQRTAGELLGTIGAPPLGSPVGTPDLTTIGLLHADEDELVADVGAIGGLIAELDGVMMDARRLENRRRRIP